MRDERNRRLLFEKYARIKGFDPRVAANWYSEPQEDIVLFKVLPSLLSSSSSS